MRGLGARIEVLRDLDRAVVRVRLSGEFDAHDLEALREALDGTVNTQSPTSVDLSGVTFMDARCGRELALRSRSTLDRLTLRNLSWQASASLRACRLAERSELRSGGDARGTGGGAEARTATKDGTANLVGVA